MVFVIAEIGINHMGNMNIARKLIHDAAECGADMAKFQWYSVDDLFGDPSKPTYRKDIHSTIKTFELDIAKVLVLNRWCEMEGIEFGCSIFDQHRFERLEELGVKRHKIASRVSKHDRELAEMVLDTGKPTFVSLGFDADPFDTAKYPNCQHLYCVASYPTEYNEIHMPKHFDDSIYEGFSSHSMTPYPSMMAVARGAKVVEVHFTLDKGMAAIPGGFDHICSLDKAELGQLVKFCREVEKIPND